MAEGRRVLLTIGCSRASERGILRGIVRYCRLHGPWVLYREPPFYRRPPYCPSPEGAPTSAPLDDRELDGVVAFAGNDAQLRAFIPPGFPAVVIPIEDKIPGCCSIVEEANAVGCMAAEHFLDRGFTRFAFCGYDHMYWSRVRHEGFTQRLAQAGFAVETYEPPGPSGHLTWEAERAAMADWLRSVPKPIGLLACNDDRAQQVFEAHKAAGVRVPDEIAILGVDNDDMICELTNPPLSSIALRFETVGYEAAGQLDLQMQGKEPSVREIYLRPAYICTRQSTDVLAVEDPVVARALRFIRNRAGAVISVDDVAEAVCISRRLLERHFRAVVGRSVYKEIQRVHIDRACQMLVQTNWSLTEIARRCGFSNAVHFGVAFKRLTRVTPQQHRGSYAQPRAIPFSSRPPQVGPADPRVACVAKSKRKDAKSNTPMRRIRRK